MAGQTVELDKKTLWGGKESPFQTSYGKLMMWFFLVSDALTFGGLLVSYGFVRHANQDAWPIGEETFNSLPFLGHGYPLIYVALMTFILIISSVTMVLAVEAGHRMDKKGVVKWMIATIIGGFFFLGSQAWEWYHFTHGSEFGRVTISNSGSKYDGTEAIVQGHFGEIQSFKVISSGTDHKKGDEIKDDLMHHFQHAASEGHLEKEKGKLLIHLEDGSVATVQKEADEHLALIIKKGEETGTRIEGKEAENLYYQAITSGNVRYGATFFGDDQFGLNEYGPTQYAQFFYFITGFHGFHVFSGVIINIIICIGVMLGTYHKRGHYEMVEKTGLYWHFVDLVWVFVFTFFYLL